LQTRGEGGTLGQMARLSLAEKLELLRDRYWLAIGPLLLLIGIGLASSSLLFWVAISLFAVLTVNKLAPRIR